jgi:hypothetical protein
VCTSVILICIGFKLFREEHDSYREYDNRIIHHLNISTSLPLRCNLYSNLAKVEWKEI